MQPRITRPKNSTPAVLSCKMCSNGDIILPACRLQYPSLDKPTQYQGEGPAKYRATFIFSEDADLSLLESEIERLKKENKPRPITRQNYEVIRDDKDNIEAGFGIGVRFVSATSGKPIALIDLDGNNVDSMFFAPGAVVRPRVNLYVSTKVGPPRVNAGLRMIQFVKDGEPLASGGGFSDPSDFDAIDPDEIPF